MNGFAQRFLSFDKLIGPSLIKLIYFIGLGLIVLGTVFFMLMSLMQMGNSVTAAVGGLILAPVAGLIYLILWRFLCEIYLLFFRISDDLRDVRNHWLGTSDDKTEI